MRNTDLAYKVLDHIDAHPEQWDQGIWIGEESCGTVACFAGWAVLLSGVEPVSLDMVRIADLPESVRPKVSDTSIRPCNPGETWLPNAAKALLGLGDDDGLFAAHRTRAELGEMVQDLFGPRPRPEANDA